MFQKICAVAEERKPANFGVAEEHAAKNRSESVIPYDRNRVILSPLAIREHATYINASFIEVRLVLVLYCALLFNLYFK